MCSTLSYSSPIIEEVDRHCQSDPSLVSAYFYFDFNEPEKQRPENLIRSLITQLSSGCSSCPEALINFYSRHQEGTRQPTTDTLLVLLSNIFEAFKEIYVVIDALDECTDRAGLLSLIETIIGWNNLHVLVTSRREQDIIRCLEPIVTAKVDLQKDVVDSDIFIHIQDRLQNDEKLKWPLKIQKQITDTLMKGAHGM